MWAWTPRSAGLTIKDVEAEALLKVRLDNVARIIDRVLDTIDNNPEIVGQLVEQVGRAAGEVAGGPGRRSRSLPGVPARRSRTSLGVPAKHSTTSLGVP